MKAASIGVPALALLFAVGGPGVAWAADVPVAHPVTSAFRLVQSLPGTVVTYPPTSTGPLPANAAQIHRGMTLSGTVTGLNPDSPATELGITVHMDLARYLRTGQGYAQFAVSSFGTDGAVGDPDQLPGRWAQILLASRATTIYGGTSEVQLNIIAERLLGLPRDP